jgi:hypothetical protein
LRVGAVIKKPKTPTFLGAPRESATIGLVLGLYLLVAYLFIRAI